MEIIAITKIDKINFELSDNTIDQFFITESFFLFFINIYIVHFNLIFRASAVLLKLVSASPESVSTKKKRELLECYKTKMDLINKRIEEAREKWNIVQNESTNANKQLHGHRSLRLTLEQELVIKGNLSETYVYNK